MSYNFDIPVGSTTSTYSATIDTDTLSCDGVTYRLSPQLSFDQQNIAIGNYPYQECRTTGATLNGRNDYGCRAAISIEKILETGYVYSYTHPDLNSGMSQFSGETGQSATDWSDITFSPFSSTTAIPYNLYTFLSQWVTGINNFTIATNIPVFRTNYEASQYIQDGIGIQNAVNYRRATQLSISVTTGAGGSATAVIDISKYRCDGEEYLSNPKYYLRYRASSIYGWYMKSECDVIQHSNGLSQWGYRVGFSVSEILRVGRAIGDNDYSYTGVAYTTQNREGQSQGGYESITLTTYNDCGGAPSHVLDWTDFRVSNMPEFVFSTNAPIFFRNEELKQYIRYGTGIEKAINYRLIPPIVEANRYTSAKLNLLRRRLIKLAIGEIDYSRYFEYEIKDGYAWLTKAKGDLWYQDFGNYDIYIPDTIEGYPVVVVSQTWTEEE